MRRIGLLSLATLLIVSAGPAFAGDGRPTRVNAAGGSSVTDPSGFVGGMTYVVNASIKGDGIATGNVGFRFGPEFSELWGAVPGVHLINLNGTITGGSVSPDGTVTLTGTLTETDLGKHGGIVFLEENVPFKIVIPAGSDGAFTLQWCELPTFDAYAITGAFRVR